LALILSIFIAFKSIAFNLAPVFIIAIVVYKFFRVLAKKSRLEEGWRLQDELMVFLNHACFFVVIEGDEKYLLVFSFGIYQFIALIEKIRKSKPTKDPKSK
jgi:hypothetical protein